MYKRVRDFFIVKPKVWFKKIVSLNTAPHSIALGFAVGAVVGVFPTFGLGLLIISFIAVAMKCNVPAAVLGAAVGNPLFTPFWIGLSYKVGDTVLLFLDLERISFQGKSWITKSVNFGLDYLIGNILICIVVGVGSYFIVKRSVVYYRSKKRIASPL
jgi:uncharacterized protein (DUF2062 family)